ncbi:MAG: NUDIX hydrolase [Bacteroidetes bacterium]|nr:NUDIX hydrolase [Bacteroidota bacterium]MCL5025974.1 NUDIX hydrolase [Chloroflexota bacterium]
MIEEQNQEQNRSRGLRPWRTIDRREVFGAPPWVHVSVERILLPDGRLVDDFYCVRLHEYAMIIARTADGQIVMERQYRHGPGAVTLLLPAGDLEPGEDALAAAQRELLEETGFTCDGWIPLGSLVVDDNRGCGKAYYFLGTNARRVAAPRPEGLEEIEIELMSPQVLLEAARSGAIVSMATIAGVGLAYSHGAL